MSSINYTISFEESGPNGLVISPAKLIEMCFYGINLCTVDGRTISDNTIASYIYAAQAEVERVMNVKLLKQVVKEEQDFSADDWRQWGFMRVNFPASITFSLEGWVNSIQQVKYPNEWLSVRKTSDGQYYQRSIFMVPVGNATANFQVITYAGITPFIGLLSFHLIPNYWQITYGTGFARVPDDMVKAVAYLAAIPIYMWLSNAILPKGVNSYSISIDGLSQSRSTEAGGYTTRVKQLKEDLGDLDKNPGLLRRLRDNFYELTITSC